MSILIYASANLLRIYVISRLMKCFFSEEKIGYMSIRFIYLLYFVINSLLFVLVNVPILNLAVNIMFMFIITFCYRSGISKKIIAVLFIYLICALAEVFVDRLRIVLNLGIETRGTFVSVVSGLVMLVIVNILERVIFVRNEYFINFYQKTTLILIPFSSIFIVYYIVTNISDGKSGIISIALLILINVFVLYLFDNIVRISEEVIENRNLAEINKAYKKQLAIISSSEERISVMRHDFKNHMIKLGTYIEKDIEKAKAYIKEISNFTSINEEYVNTGNPEIDGFLNYKIWEIKDNGCEIDSKIMIPSNLGWSSFDLTALMGNLLDNAKEAAVQSDEKNIELKMYYDRNILKIKVTNSYKDKPKVKDNIFVTIKKDKEMHGYGMKIIKNVVDKYSGNMDIKYSDNEFAITIILFGK